MSFFLIKKMKFKINFKDEKLVFLLLTTVAPIFLMLLTSMIMGAKIRTMWMTPFYLFAGTLIIYIFKSQINLNKLKSFASVFINFISFFSIYLCLCINKLKLTKELIMKEKK